MESILTSVKKMLGITEEYEYFDNDIIMHINSVFFILYQLGVGSDIPFCISDKTATWKDFLGDSTDLDAVKSYMYMKVRLLFDPPTTTSTMEAMTRLVGELEWRLAEEAEFSEAEE